MNGSGRSGPSAGIGGSTSGPSNTGGGGPSNGGADHTSIVLEYLVKRGYSGAAAALRNELESNAAGGSAGGQQVAAGRTVNQDTFAARNLGANAVKKNSVNGPLGSGPVNAAGGIREDPTPFRDGLLGLREFVLGSLDIHRPELQPILLPVFVHCFFDLILLGYKDQADQTFAAFSNDYNVSHPHILRLLAACKTPEAIYENEEAIRWRKERYVVRMTRRGWSLLLGWLQGGAQVQGGLAGAINGHGAATAAANPEVHERGREKMLGIINERVRVDLIDLKTLTASIRGLANKPSAAARHLLEGGLESELLLDTSGEPPSSSVPASIGPAVPPVKLGPFPLDAKLDKEVQRVLKADSNKAPGTGKSIDGQANGVDTFIADMSVQSPQVQVEPSLPAIAQSDLPPYPPSFRTVDVRREVEKVRESRRRIRLGPLVEDPAAKPLVVSNTASASQSQYSLPSVCMFTLHDAGDTITTTSFSDDSSLLAAGFSESYIRLWNLRGEPLAGMRSDFEPDDIRTTRQIAGLKKRGHTSTTRKLVGHSGPVYSLSFDPLPGSSGPPKYLLSASQDSTVRLWSMDTYSTIVAYRGHRDPVWDVEWGPRGVYFATASRDRTARLWTTERVAAVRIFAGHLSDVDSVRFHPNSLYLGTASSDRTCRLWDIQKGTCVRVFVGHSGPVSTIAFSPDGRYLASSGDDLNVNLWDIASGRLIKSMAGHSGRIHSLAFSSESSLLVSGSADCTMKVWDVKTGVTSPASNSTDPANTRSSAPRSDEEAANLLVSFPTKRTPIYTAKFTPRNLCLAAGPLM